MKKYKSLKIFFILFIFFFMCINCNSNSGKKNLYKVGFKEITFFDSSRGRTLKTAIWYPTKDGKKNTGTVIINGSPDTSKKPYPLILFSHGHRSINTQSSLLMQTWASHGFIVVAPNHEKNTYKDYDDSYQGMMQFARPIDIRFITDQILMLNKDPKSFLYGMVNPESIGISGHSFGGHTTLITAGATPNLDHLADYCKTNIDNWDICSRQDEIQKLYPGKRIIEESDPRMKAALAMAPDGYGWFLKDGMGKINIPIMIMSGEMDKWCPLETQQRPMYEGIDSTKYLVIQKKADHLSFGNASNGSIVFEQIANITSAFWMIHLKNDKQASAFLLKYVSSQQDVKMLSNILNNQN